MKYRKKPVMIEAFQMTQERRASNEDWPDPIGPGGQDSISCEVPDAFERFGLWRLAKKIKKDQSCDAGPS